MSALAAVNFESATTSDPSEYIPILDAVEKGLNESVLRVVGDFFNPSLNREKTFGEEVRRPELPEPPNETDSEALYRGLISYGKHKSVEFQSLQKWEGIVQEIHEDYFIAKLVDLTSGLPEEVAEFPFEEISEDDKALVEPGAVFYWNIGYQISPTRQKRRTSLIRFRRLPAWSQKDLDRGKKLSQELSKALGLQ